MPTVTYELGLINSLILNTNNNAGNEGAPALVSIGPDRFFFAYDNGSDLYGNILSAEGVPLSQSAAGVSLNTTTANAQNDVAATRLASGNAVMAFTDASAGASAAVIRLRVIDQNFNPVTVSGSTNDFAVAGLSSGDQVNADIAALADGGFVVAWTDVDAGNTNDVMMTVYNADFTVRASGVFVRVMNDLGSDSTSDPQVAALAGGGFVVVWAEKTSPGTAVWFQRYDASGAPQGSATLVDDFGSVNDQPEVVGTQNGGFAIIYRDNGWAADNDITLARYNASGVLQGYDWINQNDFGGAQGNPAITELSNGMLVVAFDQDTGAAAASRATRYGLFSASGAELISPALAATTSDQMALTSFSDGRFVATWRDTVDPGDGGPGTDVIASVIDMLRFTQGDATNEALVGDGLRDVINGADGSDLIFGLGAGDVLDGGAGGDFIDPGLGADTVDGGADFDVVSYLSVTTGAGPVINLINQALTSGVAAGDFFSNVEAFYLSNWSDTFINDDAGRFVYMFGGDDAFTGGAGSDYVDGGHGADNLNLAGGFDYASYNSAGAGVTINLLNTAANTGDAAGDVYTGVEAFVLTNFGDNFTGGAGQNFAFGYGGADNLREGAPSNDWLFGGDGADRLYGGAFADLLTGEADIDFYEYRSPAEGGDSILTFQTGLDEFYMLASAFGFTAGATLTNGTNFISAVNPLPTTAGPTFLYYTSGFLYFDADGTGSAAPVAIAQILGAPTVAAGDFVFF